ncbi:hypothetical protein [Halorubellus sp. PRR65]|uniref:hypothetical protein n=1 Tax=Halorubellus sp. PRR65 TaxID=3098148 RepID=UPI002B25997A|nr:hypothetical protein [Halorubellus sp. PRR65]
MNPLRSALLDSRAVTRAARAGIVAVLVAGAFTRNVSVIVNATGALAVSYLPGVIRRDLDVPLPPWTAAYVAVAVLLHGVGMVALYDDVWWWDHLTHVLSATVVGGVGYLAVTAFDEHDRRVHIPQPYLGAYVVAFALAAGVLWEVGEEAMRALAIAAGFDPVLVVYGLEDSVLDLVFDAAGGVVVALFGHGPLAEPAGYLADRLRD